MSLDYIGIDVHKLSSQVCILTSDGELLERRIKTDRQSLAQMFAGRTPARILIEASTESEWVARYLEELGHEVNRRRSELRSNVCDSEQESEDRPARCAHAVRSLSARGLPSGASHVGQAAAHPRPTGRA